MEEEIPSGEAAKEDKSPKMEAGVAEPVAKAAEASPEPNVKAETVTEEKIAAEEIPAVVEEPIAAPAASIRLEKKHPLAIRWMHWINFPVLATMIWSGLLIYWGDSQINGENAHQVYRVGVGSWTLFRFFPPWFWDWYGAAYKITVGLGYHCTRLFQ